MATIFKLPTENQTGNLWQEQPLAAHILRIARIVHVIGTRRVKYINFVRGISVYKISGRQTLNPRILPFSHISECRLFTYVDESLFTDNTKTYKVFIDLLDNYNPMYGVDEDFTPSDLNEQNIFLDTILATKVMTTTFNFLKNHGKSVYRCSSGRGRGKIRPVTLL